MGIVTLLLITVLVGSIGYTAYTWIRHREARMLELGDECSGSPDMSPTLGEAIEAIGDSEVPD